MTNHLVHRLRRPQTTVRWRLTMMYAGLFLVCGAALLAVTYLVVSRATETDTQISPPLFERVLQVAGPPSAPGFTAIRERLANGLTQSLPGNGNAHARAPAAGNGDAQAQAPGPSTIKKVLHSAAGRRAIVGVSTEQRVSDLHTLELWSAIALGIMAVFSGALGWVVAGSVLRPLRTITATTRQISEANLHERLAMPGPRDELRTLADTIDGLLERLQSAFDAQRRFVANASHELRTPLTAAQALLEMVMSDPTADADTFRAVCGQVLEESAQQEELIDALLALARGQRGIDRREPVALAELSAGLVRQRELDAQANGLTLDVSLQQATAAGDRRLLERLVANLLDNAIRHNIHGGTVSLHVAPAADGRATLSIANTGPVVGTDEIERLLQPFQRMAADRTGPRDGLGLGLSIVAAVASAHGATLDVKPNAGGGLQVKVVFPPAPRQAALAAPTLPLAPVPA